MKNIWRSRAIINRDSTRSLCLLGARRDNCNFVRFIHWTLDKLPEFNLLIVPHFTKHILSMDKCFNGQDVINADVLLRFKTDVNYKTCR